ncbi:GTP pyrophosphokinase family protein [Streptomyces sp. NPDC059566]|uniref:GTP pyrophosphokinase n=1 Tax=Streptomyces sp. NPDC059566 TaxID=3346866 RepID=UPI0036CD4AED
MATERAGMKQQFLDNSARYEALKTEVTHTLEKALESIENVKIHSVTARVKSVESFLEKVERKDYADPFKQSEDLVGIRIVCLFLTDLPKLKELLARTFDVISEEDKVNRGDASSFGYMSHHYICRLSAAHSGPRYDDIKAIKFEVQARTVLMDAWANISHHLAYKNEESIPVDLVRDFHALSGLLYVADRQFETLNRDAAHSAARAEKEVLKSADIQDSAINSDTVRALLQRQYPDRKHANEETVSEFISELPWIDLSDLRDLAKILRDNHRAALEYEKQYPPGLDGRGSFADIGLARAALAIYSPEYAAQKYSSVDTSHAEFRNR